MSAFIYLQDDEIIIVYALKYVLLNKPVIDESISLNKW